MPTTEYIDPLEELVAANIEPGPDHAPPLFETMQRIEATRGATRTRRIRRPRRTFALTGATAVVAVAASLAVVSGPSQPGGSAPLGVLQAAAATAKADRPSARFAGFEAETTVTYQGGTEHTWTRVHPVSDTEFEGQLVTLLPAQASDPEKRLRETSGDKQGKITVTEGTMTTEREGDQVRRTISWRRPYGTLFSGALAPGERPATAPSTPQQAREAVASWAAGEPPAGEEASVANLLRDSVGNGDRTQLALSYARLVLTAPRVAPDVRAAVYEALAALPGVQVDRNAKDGLGRPAAALITETEHGPSLTRSELLIDPSTARVLGERSTFSGEGSQETTYRYQD